MRVVALRGGLRAALATPLWLRGQRWRSLLEPATALRSYPSPHADDAVRTALVLLRTLARLRVPGWRNTCLYRGVAECLALRAGGVDARLRIGVGREAEGTEGIVAHAWVIRPGQPDADADARAATLRILEAGR